MSDISSISSKNMFITEVILSKDIELIDKIFGIYGFINDTNIKVLKLLITSPPSIYNLIIRNIQHINSLNSILISNLIIDKKVKVLENISQHFDKINNNNINILNIAISTNDCNIIRIVSENLHKIE